MNFLVITGRLAFPGELSDWFSIPKSHPVGMNLLNDDYFRGR